MMSGSCEDKRIAITGMGVVSPIGQGIETYWANLVQGISGITPIEHFATHDLRVARGGEIKQLLRCSADERPLPASRASGRGRAGTCAMARASVAA